MTATAIVERIAGTLCAATLIALLSAAHVANAQNSPQPPFALIGSSQAVFEGDTVTLDGGASVDLDGKTPLRYVWVQTGGISVTLSDNTAVRPTFTAPRQFAVNGELRFKLTVTNTDGVSSAPAVTVVRVINRAPRAVAVDGRTVAGGDTVTLDASGSYDPDGEALTYAWTYAGIGVSGGNNLAELEERIGGQVTLSDNTAVRPTFTAPIHNELQQIGLFFGLVVTDARGKSSGRDLIIFYVKPTANAAPVARAGLDQTVAKGVTVTLDGTGSTDPEGSALSYAWRHGNAGITLSGENTATPTFTVPADTSLPSLTFSLTVTDARGLESPADTVNIKVRPFFTGVVTDQVYTVGTTIDDLVLPTALGRGKTYSLIPLPDGLDFDAASRTLSGTPTTARVSDVIYTVTDESGNTDTLEFTMSVTTPAGVTVSAATLGVTEGGTASYTVVLTSAPSGDVIITPSSDETDVATVSAALSFTPETWDTAQTITVSGIEDDDALAGTATIRHTVASADSSYAGLTVADVAVTVADNDTAPASPIPADSKPTFTATISPQSYTMGTAIAALTLPEATGGDGELSYSMFPAVPAGLIFDAASRTVSGTPNTVTLRREYTWTVSDADDNTDASDTDVLRFTIRVVAPGVAEDPDRAGRKTLVTDLAGVQSSLVMSTVQNHLKALDDCLIPRRGRQTGGQTDGQTGRNSSNCRARGSGAGDPARGSIGIDRGLSDDSSSVGYKNAREFLSKMEFHISLNSLMAANEDRRKTLAAGGTDDGTGDGGNPVTVWGGAGETRLDNDYNAGGNDTRYDGTVWAYNTGLDYRASEALTLGAAIGYSVSDLTTTYNAGTYDETMMSITPYLLYESPSGLELSLLGGYGVGVGEVDLTGRFGQAGGDTPFTATTDSTLLYGAARVSGTMRFLENQALEVTPNVSLLGSRKTLEGYTDSAGRTIDETTATILRLTPGLEVGYRLDFAGGTVTPFASGTVILDLLDAVNDDDLAYSLGGGIRLETDTGLSASFEGQRDLGRDNVEQQRLLGTLSYGFLLGTKGQAGTLTLRVGLDHASEDGLSQDYGLTYTTPDGAHSLSFDHDRSNDAAARSALGYQYGKEIMPGVNLKATLSSPHVEEREVEGMIRLKFRF